MLHCRVIYWDVLIIDNDGVDCNDIFIHFMTNHFMIITGQLNFKNLKRILTSINDFAEQIFAP